MSTAMARRTRTMDIVRMRNAQPVGRPCGTTGRDRDLTLYAVVLHNDDRHTLKFCSTLLQEVFECSEATACVLTWQIHSDGRAIVWSGNRDAAEQKCEEAQQFQRLTTDSGYRFSSREGNAVQPPMRTTIERVAWDVSPGDRTPGAGGNGRQ